MQQETIEAEVADAESSAARFRAAAAGYSRAVQAERTGHHPPQAAIASIDAAPSIVDAESPSSSASDWFRLTVSNAVINKEPAPLPRTFDSQRRATNQKIETAEALVPGTWIRILKGEECGKVAIVLPDNECLVCIGRFSKTLPVPTHYQPVWPTTEDKALFAAAESMRLTHVHFIGSSPALSEGDKVIALPELTWGIIHTIRHIPAPDNPTIRVRYAKVFRPQPNNPNPYSFISPVAKLRRHVLDEPAFIGPLDRVRVVAGTQYMGYSGRVHSFAESSSVVVAISNPPHDMEVRLVDLPLHHLTRDFRPGDMVQVTRGISKGRVGFITTLCPAGVLEIFDVFLCVFFACSC